MFVCLFVCLFVYLFHIIVNSLEGNFYPLMHRSVLLFEMGFSFTNNHTLHLLFNKKINNYLLGTCLCFLCLRLHSIRTHP
jgi:hypothetical protein